MMRSISIYAAIWSARAWSSTRPTNPRSGRLWRASIRVGSSISASVPGIFSRPRSASSDDARLVSSESDESATHSAKPAPIRFTPDAKGPLTGIKVLDLSRLVAGNMLSLQLGDFGADVIKIEPLKGDPLREWLDGGEQLFWKTYSRNKLSAALDLRNQTAKNALLRLVEDADVFIENYRPGTLEKMGLAPDVLLARNPRLFFFSSRRRHTRSLCDWSSDVCSSD